MYFIFAVHMHNITDDIYTPLKFYWKPMLITKDKYDKPI